MLPKLSPGSFYGERRKSHQIAGLILTESIYSQNFSIPRHSRESAFFLFVLHGTCTETSETSTRMCDSSVLVFHPAGERHQAVWDQAGGRCFNLEFAPNWLDRFCEQKVRLDQPTDFDGGLSAWLALRLYQELQQTDDVSPLAMEGLALELVAVTTRQRKKVADRKPPRWLEQAHELLHAHFADTLSLSEVAASVGVHPAHLARVFRQRYHCSVGYYLRKLRIEFACRQLATSDRSFTEIGLAAGFADQSHFSKTFKSLIGMTPSEYQRNFC